MATIGHTTTSEKTNKLQQSLYHILKYHIDFKYDFKNDVMQILFDGS